VSEWGISEGDTFSSDVRPAGALKEKAALFATGAAFKFF